jgi:hypothetical protein
MDTVVIVNLIKGGHAVAPAENLNAPGGWPPAPPPRNGWGWFRIRSVDSGG